MLQRSSDPAIVIRGARQNNLKNLSLEIPTNELVVVTGVSGSGKSSLFFDTLYAEGQRRYVETFSPYARPFLARIDQPQVDAIQGIPPETASDQTNPVPTSRSTVGTMTELNDHLKLLFARAGRLFCRGCGQPVHRDSPASVYERLAARAAAAGDPRLILTFPVAVPKNFKEEEVQALLKAHGYDRIHARTGALLEVVQDRVKMSSAEKARVIEGIEAAFKVGQGKVNVYPLDADGKAGAPWRYSSDLHCAECDIHYSEPLPSLFSFNSPLGACETCRGFARVIGIDYGLIVPDESKTLRESAIRPWQSPSFHECQDDIEKYAKKRGASSRRARNSRTMCCVRFPALRCMTWCCYPRSVHARSSNTCTCLRRSTKPPTSFSPRSGRGCATSAKSASAISRSIASRARSRAARCSASTSPPRSAPRSSIRCSCWTSRPSACTRATWAA